MIGLNHFLLLSALLLGIAISGVIINRKNIIVLLMCLELILLAVNINFVAMASYLKDIHGEIFVFFILTIAACEAAIGLALLVLLFRSKGAISVKDIDLLKG